MKRIIIAVTMMVTIYSNSVFAFYSQNQNRVHNDLTRLVDNALISKSVLTFQEASELGDLLIISSVYEIVDTAYQYQADGRNRSSKRTLSALQDPLITIAYDLFSSVVKQRITSDMSGADVIAIVQDVIQSQKDTVATAVQSAVPLTEAHVSYQLQSINTVKTPTNKVKELETPVVPAADTTAVVDTAATTVKKKK